MHLPGSAFEEPAAAACKQCVAAENNGAIAQRTVIRNMPGRVTGNIQDAELEIEIGQLYPVAFGQALITGRQCFVRRSIDRDIIMPAFERNYATNVVVMVVCQ